MSAILSLPSEFHPLTLHFVFDLAVSHTLSPSLHSSSSSLESPKLNPSLSRMFFLYLQRFCYLKA